MSDKLGEVFVEIKAETDQLKKDINRLKGKLDKDAEKMGKSFGSAFDGGLKKILKAGAGLTGLYQALNFGRRIVNTASEFQQLRTRLVNLYQDTEKAGQVFDKFKKIAATTPFSLKGVVSAGATLKAFGLDAENTLKSVTDLAAYMGMDVVEAANAVGRAFAGGAGAADILRERGVLNLIKEFKGVDDLAKLTLPQFREALIESMQDPAVGIAGATDRMSKTFQGAFSNMGDAIENFTSYLGSKLLPALTGVMKGVGNLFTSLTPTADAFEKANEKAVIQKANFEKLAGTYLNLKEKVTLTNAEQKILAQTIGQLQRQYPNYLGNINLEKVGYDEAKKAIKGAREELDKYLTAIIKKGAVQANEEKFIEYGKRAFKITSQRIEAEEKLKALTDSERDEKPSVWVGENRISSGFGVDNQNSESELLQSEIDTQNRLLDELDRQAKDLKEETQKVITELEEAFSMVIAPKDGNASGTNGGVSEIIEKYSGALKKLSQLSATQIDSPSFVGTPELAPTLLPINPEAFEESAAEIVETWVTSTEAMATTFNSVTDGIAASMYELVHVRIANDASELEKIWGGVANAIIYQIEQIIAKWAVLNVLSAALGGGGISLLSVLGAASGGTFQANSTGITKMASGGVITVPAGHPTDTYPLLLRSGERAVVTPSHKVGFGESNSGQSVAALGGKLDAVNANLTQLAMQNTELINKEVITEASGESLRYLYDKRTKQRKRFLG